MGPETLAQVLRPLHERFPPGEHPDVLVGLADADDAAVYRVSDDLAVIQTLDFFPPVLDDPYLYGRIAAANALSDVYAMGGEARLCLNIAAFPEGMDPAIPAEVFRGGAAAVAEAGAVVAGGHTILDEEPKYGLSVLGVVHPDELLRAGGARPGDALLLTKPLGTGVVLTAAQQGVPGHEAALEAATASMVALNREASRLAREAGAHAVTDVTGFGLAGHASEIAAASGVRVVLEAERVPLLPDALRLAEAGAVTGGGRRNVEQLGARVRVGPGLSAPLVDLLYDPQTSGGLLVALPPRGAAALEEAGAGRTIGSVEAGPARVEIR